MTTYSMTTISNGTRIREAPNTGAKVLTSVGARATVQGVELFTAAVPLSNSAGTYQYVGDKWLKITYNGVTGWMAYVHMGEFICDQFRVVAESPDPEVPPVPAFPEWFDLTDPQGVTKRYTLAE